MRSLHRLRYGITWPEVFVLLGIIIFLLALLLPAVNKLGPCGGNRVACANHLKHIGLALRNYADMHPRPLVWGLSTPQLPAGTIPNSNLEPNQRLSWLVELLPYLEEDALYHQFDQSAPWDAEPNVRLSQTPVRIFQCPAWKSESRSANAWETPYVGIAGVGSDAATHSFGDPKLGAFGYDRRTAFVDVKDGTSNTLMVLESARDAGPWAEGGFATVRGINPEDKPYIGVGRPFGGTHLAGSNALMMDGSVHTLSDKISPEVLEALATIAGGEKVPADF
jgi:uncharacterized protein DUF1559